VVCLRLSRAHLKPGSQEVEQDDGYKMRELKRSLELISKN
jgi:hypothetical protein